MVFIVLIVVLIALTKIKIPYQTEAAGYVPLPDQDRDKVSVDFVGGAVQTIFAADDHGDTQEFKTQYKTWKVTEGVAIQPETSNVQGCSSEYTNNLNVNFTISNSLIQSTRGTVEVAVYDYQTRNLLEKQLMTLDFKPNQDASGLARFNILSFTFDPTFLVKVSFPSPAELSYVHAQVKYLPLIQYVLVLLGLLAP
jgi:hypothetical protein